MPALKIIFRSSVFTGRVVELDQPVVTLGRDPATCDVLFDEDADRVVSREHARLLWHEGTLKFEPMPGKVVLRARVPLSGAVNVSSGDVFELAGPGGPSVEVRFEPPATAPQPLFRALPVDESRPAQEVGFAQAAALPRLSVADAEAPTARSLRPVSQPAANPIPPPEEALTDPEGTPWPPPDPPAEQHTMMLPALEAEAATSTQFLRVDDRLPPAAPQMRRSKSIALWAGLGSALFVVLAFAGWSLYASADAQRRADERVSRLKEAFKDIPRPPGLSDEDWEIYATKTRKKRAEEAKKAPPKQAAPEQQPAPVVAAKDESAGQLATLREEARRVFARLKQLELERLRVTRSKRANIDAERQQQRTAYEKLVASIRQLDPAGPRQQAVLMTARHLGECDATLPAALVSKTLAAASTLAGTGGASLEKSLARARANRFTPTITAALGDQGLPLELFFLPQRASGFDEKKVGASSAGGIPKGMWQLLPAQAKQYGLNVGQAVAQASFDATDDRHRYEKETRAAAKLVRAVYEGPAAGSALLVLAFWSNGDAGPLLAAKKTAGLSGSDGDPARVSLTRLWEKDALGTHRQSAVEALATVTVATNPKVFGLSFASPIAHVEPEERR